MTATALHNKETPRPPLLGRDLAYRLHCANRDCFALSMLKMKNRNFQGYLVTGHNSGTHWIKWMFSHAMAHHYGLEPPKYFNDAAASFIANPKHPCLHPQLPRIATSHSVAPYPLQWRWLRRSVHFPAYAVIVRDIRKMLISNYEKWQSKYNVSFTEYLKGDPWSNKYITDVWAYLRLMNRWGEVASRFPDETLVLRYEDFQADAAGYLTRLCEHFRLPLTAADIAAGVAVGSKEYMAKHQDHSVEVKALRPDGKGSTVFSDEDRKILGDILDRHLKHDFGYDYLPEPRGFSCKKATA